MQCRLNITSHQFFSEQLFVIIQTKQNNYWMPLGYKKIRQWKYFNNTYFIYVMSWIELNMFRNSFLFNINVTGGFHLQLYHLIFIYQFNPRLVALVFLSFVNDKLIRISTSFQNLFIVVVTWKKFSFYTDLFCCTEMRWMFIISTTLWVTVWDTISVTSRTVRWTRNGVDETLHTRQVRKKIASYQEA